VAGCDNLTAIYESVCGKVPMHMTACDEVIGLPGDVCVGRDDSGSRVVQ